MCDYHRFGLWPLFIVGLLASPLTAAAESMETRALLVTLSAGTEGERVRAATRLYHLGRSHLGVSALTSQLGDRDAAARCLAARLLGVLRSEQALSALATILEDPDWAVRRDAAEALGQIGASRSAPALSALLDDPHARVRIAAARALSELRGGTPDGALARALRREQDLEVRLHLAEALGRCSTPRARRALRGLLTDQSEPLRVVAASHLVTASDSRGARLLSERLRSESPRVRSEAAQALAHATGPAAAVARRHLASALADTEPEVHLAAAASLAALGDRRGLEHLTAVAASAAPPEVRERARTLLERARAAAR
jgi:HEAT repeat protein